MAAIMAGIVYPMDTVTVDTAMHVMVVLLMQSQKLMPKLIPDMYTL
jgi:hypothetical protein